jgi:hypothetical protein
MREVMDTFSFVSVGIVEGFFLVWLGPVLWGTLRNPLELPRFVVGGIALVVVSAMMGAAWLIGTRVF